MLNFLYETLRLGLKNLHLHKLRSLLTALGIIFGVAAVIVMVAIGNGAKLEARKQMDKLGAQNILVRSVKPPESNDATSRQQRVLEYGLKRLDIDRIRTIPGLAKVVELRDTEARVVLGDLRANANAIATTPDIFGVLNLHLARGQYFTQLQYEQAQPVCVLGSVAARQLFPYQDPLGQAIQIGGSGQPISLLTVVGVLEPTGLRAGADSVGIMQRDIDQDVYFPLKFSQQVYGDTFTRQMAGTRERKQIELSECWLQAERSEDVEKISKVIEYMLGATHPQLRDVNIKAPIEILRNAERLNR